jgi:hypothetical protein
MVITYAPRYIAILDYREKLEKDNAFLAFIGIDEKCSSNSKEEAY